MNFKGKKINAKPILYLLISLILICGVFYMGYNNLISGDISYESVVQKNESENVYLTNSTVTQSFVAKNNIVAVRVRTGMKNGSYFEQAKDGSQKYDSLKGSAVVSLKDSGGNLVGQREFTGKDLYSAANEGEFTLPMVNPLIVNKGESYTVEFKTKLPKDYKMYAKFSGGDFYKDGQAMLNGKNVDNSDLSFSVVTPAGKFAIAIYLMLLVLVIFTLITVFVLLYSKKVKIHIVFLVMVMLFGGIYSFLISPDCVPDEIIHYETAYRWSNVLTGTSEYNDGTTNIKMRVEDANYLNSATVLKRPTVTSYVTTVTDMFKTAKSDEFVNTSGGAVGNIFQFFAPAVGISIGRILHLGAVPTYYLARFMNLLLFAILGALAVRKIPFGKPILFACSMLPITLQQVASVSYDAPIIAFSFFFIAYSLYFAYTEKPIMWYEVAAFVACSGILCAAKAGVYIFLFGIAALILFNKNISVKKRWIIVGVAVAVSLASMVGFSIASVLTYVDGSKNEFQNYPSSFALTNFPEFSKMLINTFGALKEYYVFSAFGSLLSWLNVGVDKAFLIAFPIILFISSISSEDEIKLGIKENPLQKPLALLSVICVTVILFVVALQWNEVGSEIIQGVQSRYIIPALPLIILLFRNKTIISKKNLCGTVAIMSIVANSLIIPDIIRAVYLA